jgi:ABC-type transport system involved in multi-copper enzyme maturation permease subunit
MCTAWLLLARTQAVRNVGDVARFGAILFQVLAPLQLALAMFFSTLLAASTVTMEKDRRTLVLLLLTNLTNTEIVLGKVLSGLLNIAVLLVASLPVFMLCLLFGSISPGQILRVFAVSGATALATGSLGGLIAFWREKTFQTLALSLLTIVFWLALGEAVAWRLFGDAWAGISAADWAASISPWRATLLATRPALHDNALVDWIAGPIGAYVGLASGIALALNLVAIARVRVWNPSREERPRVETDEEQSPQLAVEHSWSLTAPKPTPAASVHAAGGRTRSVWNNPVIWREIRTWAYGRRILAIRLGYLLLFTIAAVVLHNLLASGVPVTRWSAALILIPVCLLSLILVNAQSVTALTSERDLNALDLLLVTDLSAREFIFGKLGGVLYNSKEMILLPLALCIYLWLAGAVSAENLAYLIGGMLVLNAFVAMLGLHSGLHYESSRSAIAVSLGTVFFLFVGIATCMRLMVAFSGSFQAQFQPFLAIIGGGSFGLYVALSGRNPSPAIALASLVCPIGTFWAMTSFVMQYTLGVFLMTVVAYGFATAAMFVPAIFEFEVTSGRAASDE